MGVFLRRSRAANSVVGGPIWPKFELIHNIMHALVTSKFEKDRINIIALWSLRLWKRDPFNMLLVHLFVYIVCVLFLSIFFSSWCRWFGAACACGTPWTFHCSFFIFRPFLYYHIGQCIHKDTIFDFLEINKVRKTITGTPFSFASVMIYEPRHEKTCLWPVKTQTGLLSWWD